MSIFRHISQNPEPVTKENFRKPNLLLPRDNMSYLPNESIFMSSVLSCGMSTWQIHSIEKSREIWIDKYHHDYVVDFATHNILVIDNSEDLYKLFDTYGEIDEFTKREILKNSKCQSDILKNISIIEIFLESISDELKIQAHNNIKTITKEACLIKKYKINDIIIDDKIKIPKSGKSLKFIKQLYKYVIILQNDLECEIKREKIIYDTYHFYSKIKYDKIFEDGFNGIYFSSHLIDKKDEIKGMSYLCYIDFLNFIATDTLVMWNWVL